jgi:predicted Zn-dependent protease with MMP-like domain
MLFKRERKFAFCAGEKQDCCMKTDWKHLQELALAEIEATLEALPKPLREQAWKLPVTFEKAPNAGLQADGIDADTLGLFTGAEFADDGGTVLPPQIILFLENLWDFAEGDQEVFCDEVHTTFLHELGHFFGLGEDDLTERGLE